MRNSKHKTNQRRRKQKICRIYQRHRRRLPRLEKIRLRERNNYNQFCEHNRKKITKWAKLLSSEHGPVDKRDKFPSLLRCLLEQKEAIEYENAELRSNSNLAIRGSLHYLEKKDDKVAIPEGQGTSRYKRNKCLHHEGANHWTTECRLYLSKPVQERRDTLKEKGACWSCLKRGHRIQDCRGKKPCEKNNGAVCG